VIREADRVRVRQAVKGLFTPELVVGGATRHDSEWNALQALASDIDGGRLDVVAIHDAARPLGGSALFEDVLAAAWVHGGAIPVHPRAGLLSREPGRVLPDGLVGVSTPQAFRARELLAAYRAAERDGFRGTDTAGCIERYTDLEVRAVRAPATNLKVTFPEDVAVAGRLLRALSSR
jgi:2-C-methyl-D-erythritol 4-phosphate cytidylyltransferase